MCTPKLWGIRCVLPAEPRSSVFLSKQVKATLKRVFFSLALLFFFSSTALASHVVGGQITYTYLSSTSTSNSYLVRVTLFRDCAGIAMPTAVTAVARNGSSIIANLTLTQFGTSIDRSIVCPGQQSTCTNPSSTIPGVQEYIYQTALTLPNTLNVPVTISHSTCCRANGVSNLSSPGSQETYLSTIIPAQNLNLNNNSPVFLNPPNGVFCQNQLASLSLNAFDPDGDALVYSIVAARRGSATSPLNCTYAAGFSATTPMSTSTPVVINSSTGVINFTPTVLNQRAVVAIRVEEYRGGG